jgi:hypothetical protein
MDAQIGWNAHPALVLASSDLSRVRVARLRVVTNMGNLRFEFLSAATEGVAWRFTVRVKGEAR